VNRLLILSLCLLLGACDLRPSKPHADYGTCLASHEETTFVPMYTTICNGSSCSPMLSGMLPVNSTVCDSYQYPFGDGPGYHADVKRYERELAEWKQRNPGK